MMPIVIDCEQTVWYDCKKEKNPMSILFVIYLVVGYWAVGVVLYENKIVMHTFGTFFLWKLSLAVFLGVILIPIAILKRIFFR